MRAMANVAHTNVLRNSQRGEGQNKKTRSASISKREELRLRRGDFPAVPRPPSVARPEADAPSLPDRRMPFVFTVSQSQGQSCFTAGTSRGPEEAQRGAMC